LHSTECVWDANPPLDSAGPRSFGPLGASGVGVVYRAPNTTVACEDVFNAPPNAFAMSTGLTMSDDPRVIATCREMAVPLLL
jgi:hypothetical protein